MHDVIGCVQTCTWFRVQPRPVYLGSTLAAQTSGTVQLPPSSPPLATPLIELNTDVCRLNRIKRSKLAIQLTVPFWNYAHLNYTHVYEESQNFCSTSQSQEIECNYPWNLLLDLTVWEEWRLRCNNLNENIVFKVREYGYSQQTRNVIRM
jgi:hypothetical protein